MAKFKLPFFKMHVRAFQQKLRDIPPMTDRSGHPVEWRLRSISTEVITVSQFKAEFEEIPQIKERWDRIEIMLRQPVFREVLKEDKETVANVPDFE
mmetsp:Transcript_8421/g.12826  ORF Transcript_8421/g.12826 Transcript_8421/m.12826 type:complete len:96 (+) Transcript_8421:102-389(+)